VQRVTSENVIDTDIITQKIMASVCKLPNSVMRVKD
jgi:hypothetical protein